jgi:methylisocitrate lyase
MIFKGIDRCRKFRSLLDKGGLCLPGAHCGLIGRMIASIGFKACYISGGALSAMTGVPDIGFDLIHNFS